MGRRSSAVVLSAVVSVLAGAPGATASTPGHWTQVTDSTARNIDEVSVARTANGTLHAVWTRPTPSNPGSGRDLLEVPISASGVVGARVLLASNWATLSNPSVLASGGNGLDVFVGAIRSIDSNDPIANLAMLTSVDGGASWELTPADLTKTGAAYASDVSAALGSGGTPFITWGSSNCLCVHRGTSQGTPNTDFQQGLGDFGYEPGIALDRTSGQLVVAWYSNGTGHKGIYAAPVDQATGARIGPPARMPGTAVLLDGPLSGRTQIAARAGGGVYVAYPGAYPSHTNVLLWRVGAPASALLARSASGVRSVGVASTPTGRLWVYWSAKSPAGSPIVYARRSNAQATAWGATVAASPPHGASTSWNLVGSGQTDRLDLMGSFSLGSSSTAATWYTQLFPGLALTASRTQLPVGTAKAQKLTFFVSDAGTAVVGASVRVGSAKGTTNGKGKVTLALGPFRHKARLLARASRKGYISASVTLRVK